MRVSRNDTEQIIDKLKQDNPDIISIFNEYLATPIKVWFNAANSLKFFILNKLDSSVPLEDDINNYVKYIAVQIFELICILKFITEFRNEIMNKTPRAMRMCNEYFMDINKSTKYLINITYACSGVVLDIDTDRTSFRLFISCCDDYQHIINNFDETDCLSYEVMINEVRIKDEENDDILVAEEGSPVNYYIYKLKELNITNILDFIIKLK